MTDQAVVDREADRCTCGQCTAVWETMPDQLGRIEMPYREKRWDGAAREEGR